MKQQSHNNDLKVGSRFRLSALGVKRCHRFKTRTGVIVGLSPTGSSLRVMLEGGRQPVTLHESYVEPDSELGTLRHHVAIRDRAPIGCEAVRNGGIGGLADRGGSGLYRQELALHDSYPGSER